MLASSSNVDEMFWGYIAGLGMVVGLHYDFFFLSFLSFLGLHFVHFEIPLRALIWEFRRILI